MQLQFHENRNSYFMKQNNTSLEETDWVGCSYVIIEILKIVIV